MALQINWTANALEDYKLIFEYLCDEWTISIAERFVENVESKLETLSYYPFLGKESIKQPAIRNIFLTKHNRLYYRVTSSAIEILNIFDTRQDPTKNQYD